jgi:hypothetical protein
MAKITLNTNLADSTYTVEYKSIDVDINKNVSIKSTDLSIIPINNRVIDAKDFSHGSLPSIINRIEFYNTEKLINTSNKIKAVVFFNPIKITQRQNAIFLPISGSSTIFNNEYSLVETTSIDSRVIVKKINHFDIAVNVADNLQKITHTITGGPNKTIKILSKALTVPEGYHFAIEPSYTIKGLGVNGYSMRTSIIRDNIGRIISKIFNLSYTFPDIQFKNRKEDQIVFNYSAKQIPISGTTQSVDPTEITSKIYGFDTGRALGAAGGEKRISITGAPGSTFKLIVQDASKQMYNFDTGVFETGAPLLVGEIPPAKKGFAYGEYKTIVEVPASTSGDEVKTVLIRDDEIDHSLLAAQSDATETVETSEQAIPTEVADVIVQEGSFVFAIKNGGEAGFVIQRPLIETDAPGSSDLVDHEDGEYFANGTYTIGAAAYTSSILQNLEDYPIQFTSGENTTLTWLITTNADNKYIRINREPNFKQTADYVRWDSAYGGEDSKSSNSEGLDIATDWGTSVRHTVTSDTSDGTTLDFQNSELAITIHIAGAGDVIEHGVSDTYDPLGYASVFIHVDITGTFGTTTVSPELNLKNFLTIHTL